jgi:hypothetical protein
MGDAKRTRQFDARPPFRIRNLVSNTVLGNESFGHDSPLIRLGGLLQATRPNLVFPGCASSFLLPGVLTHA